MRTRAEKLTEFPLPSGSVLVDEANFIVDPKTWTPEFAEAVAEIEDIELTPRHWAIIKYMREYRDDHGIAVDARYVFKFLSETEGLNKHDAKELFFKLFPYGYVKQACKMSGMKYPRAWSTG